MAERRVSSQYLHLGPNVTYKNFGGASTSARFTGGALTSPPQHYPLPSFTVKSGHVLSHALRPRDHSEFLGSRRRLEPWAMAVYKNNPLHLRWRS